MTVAMAMSKTVTFDMHLTNINGIAIDITIAMLVIVMAIDGFDWFTLLWTGWLNILQNISQKSGSFAAVNRLALLSWLVCSSVEGVAKDYSKHLPREWELCFGESVCPFVLVGLLFCGGGG
jgi:hypothetical protein